MTEGSNEGERPVPPDDDVTKLLHAAAQGQPLAAEQLLPVVYAQLRALAQKYMLGERAEHTLQATALVHEAYLRLVGNTEITWKDRGHFYMAAANAMRRVLVDHARRSGAVKRGGDWNNVSLHLADLAEGRGLGELLVVDDAIEKLTTVDAQAAAIVRLRFFAGLSVDETALALGLSPRTVDREWDYARAWLRKALSDEDPGGSVNSGLPRG
ncbi:MAG: sigma-70 family RNA polymerase sigma factor [Planctomycetes bacterium]|nr:sigma-70 family RNA polymerase sigma factor [Planctomycetota bacterium]MBI3846626.1 sigma-70 family RNA polymerase sigma factor [Planctomycetota bacterium]